MNQTNDFFGLNKGERVFGTYRGIRFVGSVVGECFNDKTLEHGLVIKLENPISGERICSRQTGDFLTILPRTSTVLGLAR